MVFAVLLTVSVAAGCKKKAAGGSDCASLGPAMDRMMDTVMKEEGKDIPPDKKKEAEDMMKQMMPKMKTAMIKSCTDDKWSADMITCVNSAKSQADMKGCDAKLTPDQKTKLDKNMMEAMGMGGGPEAPPAPEGSAAPTEGSAAPAEGSAAAPAGSAAPAEGSAAPAGSAK
jgi:hypothetical protein